MNKVTFLVLLISNFLFAQNVVLDNSFGVGGKVINSNITSGQSSQIQSDGKLVSCFISDFSVAGNIHLTRFNTDGTIDGSFGNSGFVDSTLVTETGGLNMMKIQNDGKILITGATIVGGFFNFATARYNNNGTIDSAFGINGFAITNFQGASFSNTLAIQNDGKILVGGFANVKSSDFAIARYLSNGLLDTTFATNGKISYNFGFHSIPFAGQFSSDFIHAIKITSSGKIIIGGNTSANESTSNFENFGFICLSLNGILDTNFGINGQKVVDFGDKDYFRSMHLTNSNDIIAVGTHSYFNNGEDFVNIPIVKLLEDGNFDTSFGTNGTVLTNRDNSNLFDAASDFIIQSDGKLIILGGTADINSFGADSLLIRFNIDGSIDTTFNENGFIVYDLNNFDDYGTALAMQNDGKIITFGVTQIATNIYYGTLARFTLENLSTSKFSSSYFSASPNPFSNNINLSFTSKENQVLDINLYDTNGRKIQNLVSQKQFYSGENQLKLDLPETLSKGIYFLNINEGQQTKSIKIVK